MIDAACKTPQEPIPPIAGDGSIHEPKELIDKKVKVPVMREIASDFNTIFFFMKFTIFFTLKICRYEGFLKKIKDLGEDFKDWTELKLLFMESEKVLKILIREKFLVMTFVYDPFILSTIKIYFSPTTNFKNQIQYHILSSEFILEVIKLTKFKEKKKWLKKNRE